MGAAQDENCQVVGCVGSSASIGGGYIVIEVNLKHWKFGVGFALDLHTETGKESVISHRSNNG